MKKIFFLINPIKRNWVSILSPILLLFLWEIVSSTGLLRADYFPPPSSLPSNFKILIEEGDLALHIGATLYRLSISFLLASIPGIGLGLVMGLSITTRLALEPFVNSLYAIPKIALLPLMMMALGIGERSLIVTAAITAFFQITITTMAGVMSIEKVLLEAAKNYGATGWRLFLKVILPGTLPFIFTGLRLGLGLSLILVIAVELAAAKTGLGALIWISWQVLRIKHMYCTLIVIGSIGLLVTHGLEKLGGTLMPWREEVVRRWA